MCGSAAVREVGDTIRLSLPPEWDERWWCGCGYRGKWEVITGSNVTTFGRWKKANGIDFAGHEKEKKNG
jgi:hypothetical protein